MKLNIFLIFLLFCITDIILSLKELKIQNLLGLNTLIKSKIKAKVEFKKFEFEFSSFNFDTKMFSKFYSRKYKDKNTKTFSNLNGAKSKGEPSPSSPLPSSKAPLDSLQASLYRDLNNTDLPKDSNQFREANRKWDYKILDKQLEEIFGSFLYKQDERMTIPRVRNYMEIFMNNYQACDKDKDNVLNLIEFSSCMTTDPYLSRITPPPPSYAAIANYTIPAVFYTTLFNVLDERYENYVNFVGYMKMRLMAFSWKQCSISAPYLEEVDFECALEISSGFRTATRTTARNIFKLALELSNNNNIRNLDFISYFIVANTVRLYGKINGKEDNYITKAEFNLALDDNLLPIRYSQDIINQIFKLVEDHDRPDQGIDVESFIYYDFILQLFSFNSKKRPYFLNIDDFNMIMTNVLFPFNLVNEISLIPQYKISQASYGMYQYFNISQNIAEGDYLFKFLEVGNEVGLVSKKKSKLLLEKRYARSNLNGNSQSNNRLDNIFNAYNISYTNNTLQLIFNSLDYEQDNWINFYDFGTFMQIAYIFSKADEFDKGKLTAGQLFELFKSYSDYPVVSYKLRERSERFNLLDQNVYVDLLSAIQILKIKDIIKYYLRKIDNTNVYEVEIKRILSKLNMVYIPDGMLIKCSRGIDGNNIPNYDWDCCFTLGMNSNLKYFESMNNYKEMKMNNLTVSNTAFYNVDNNYL